MTIDERIEALTTSLELFERHTRERTAQHERELDAVRERQARIDNNMIVQGELLARLEHRTEQFMAWAGESFLQIKQWTEEARTQIAELQVLVRTAHERLDQRR